MTTLEIVARPNTPQEVRSEFLGFLDRAKAHEWNELKVLFGFAWGNFIYENDWIEETMTPEQLADRVSKAESLKDGKIGSDDLYVKVSALEVEYTFCHEADIHLEGPEESPFIVSERDRFKAMGWAVYESSRTPNKSEDST